MNNASLNDQLLLRLWGKTDKDNPLNYHPLLFHLLDVGHVTQRLWHSALSPRLRLHLAQALGMEEPHAQHLVTLLAAQHDLGKASAFQHKDKGLWQRLQQAGLTLPLPKDYPHGFVTTAALPPLAAQGIGGWRAGKAVCQLLAQITGGHHGTFPSFSDWINIGPLTLGGAGWDAGRAALLRETARVFGEQEPIPLDCPLAALTDPALLPLLGGLISVADWIGSSHYFPPAGSLPLDDYVALSRERADKALQAFGWTAAPRFAPPASFDAVFPFPPKPMQQLAAKAAAQTEEPFLMLIEDAMGSGKTEAALYAADISLARGSTRGLYVALPTQATGNAMFERVKTYLEGRNMGGRLNLQLVHAGAALSDAFRALQQAAIYDDVSDYNAVSKTHYNNVSKTQASAEAQGRAGRIVAEGWFAARKRPLLAPFGVGTIDQSLLGVLQTRHWFVRLLGLAGKVVVLDEVHAYDVYMSRLLARLLQWLRALDCSVVLLSATLPAEARQALVSAWRGTDEAAPVAPYPRLTIARASAPAEAISAADPKAEPQDISLAWIGAGWETVQLRLRADLPQGGCALLLCNTVTRAQEAFRALHPALAKDGWEVRLFHARTLAAWRQEREHWTLTTFGKGSPQDRRSAKVLLIATQVVEQSLDLDFDWMASEMAPADLLLQRLGRLWRHPGRLRATLTPRFVILCERGTDGLPLFPPYAELIYERYVLLRSWLALQIYGDALRLPAVIEPLVQATYDAQEPQGLSPAWQQALTASREKMQRGQDDDRQTAEANSLPEPGCGLQEILEYGSRLGQVRKRLFDDDDPRVHDTVRAATRLGDPSVGVVCTGTDEDGQPLAAPPSGEPTADAARALLRFSIPLSNRRLYHALAAQDPPAAWGGSALLRYQRALEFTQGQCSLGGYALRLGREQGLVIEKPNKGEKK